MGVDDSGELVAVSGEGAVELLREHTQREHTVSTAAGGSDDGCGVHAPTASRSTGTSCRSC